ncbi:MAG: type II secretion system protein N [Desulfobacterales bacterium]|nr:type II secretion system protein N [Desulfobacterales bacterium]MDD4392413.1 type II secretion system protein N [Desulfobacterales bacterium]
MKRYFIIINMFLIMSGVYFGVKALYSIMAFRLDSGVTVQQTPGEQAVVEERQYPPLSDYKTVMDRNLFNITQTGETAASAVTVDLATLEKTDLALKLWGTVTGDRKKAYAVIEEVKSREQNLYRTGDTIQDTSASVKMILRGKVILTADGKDEILEMEDTVTEKSGKLPDRSAAVTGNTQSVDLARSSIMDAVSNLNQLMQQARLRPYFRRGIPEGLVLSNIKPDSIFNQMQLKNGDIITGVDGRDIKSVDDALKMYDSLKSSSSVALKINRRGKVQTINYTIQ